MSNKLSINLDWSGLSIEINNQSVFVFEYCIEDISKDLNKLTKKELINGLLGLIKHQKGQL